MKNKPFIVWVGILGLWTAFAYTLASQVSATSISLTSTTEPVHFQIREFTEEEKAERLEQMKSKLAQQLADGMITQEQYDEMITAFENWDFSMMKGLKNHFEWDRVELTEEQKAEMLENMKTRLAERLANNEISQAQYDEMIANMESWNFMMGFKWSHSMERPELTEEQKAEMLEKFENGEFPTMQDKFRGGERGMKEMTNITN